MAKSRTIPAVAEEFNGDFYEKKSEMSKQGGMGAGEIVLK